MQLPEELLKKLRLLTDKPISPMVNKQLLPLLLHENLNIDKAIQLLCLKYRIDLIIHLVQNGRYPSESVSTQMLSSIINNILECKVAEVLQLYILVLTRIEEDKKLLEIGYHDLLKPAIKQPNLETKQKLFQIIGSNFEYFYKRKCKKVIMAIINNYIEVFTKFLIYVPSYLVVIKIALEIDKSSKKIINQSHPQREPELEQVFIDLSSQEYSALKNQIVAILENTKQKINYYSLHRNCLVCLKNLCQILNQFKIKDRELYFTEVQVGKVCRTIEIYLDRKGTIDQARFAKAQWLKRLDDLKKIKQSKTQKYISAPIMNLQSALLLDKKQAERPLLIQQVISMANNYRLKYQVAPVQQNEESSSSRILSVSNNYLKKGNGVGGGRTHLLNHRHRSVFQDERAKMRQLYDGVINKCFAECEKDIEYKSFVDIKTNQPQHSQGIDEVNEARDRLEYDQKYNKEITQKLKQLPPIVWQPSKVNRNTNNNSYLQDSMASSSAFENDDEVREISELIQLAYCYKFS